MYFLALELLQTLDDAKSVTIFTTELIQLHKGQGITLSRSKLIFNLTGMEIYWRENSKCPSIEEYLEMVGNKTGGLLRLAVQLMQLFSESQLDLNEIVKLLGIHFQIRDDYINLKSSEYIDVRGYAEDITEGKYSFPVIHCIMNHDPNKFLAS